jgi:uncharacterized protein (DUF1810 family)
MTDDPFHLDRFITAQDQIYDRALAEIRRSSKRSHWMWFIFPQIAGLGHSSMAKYYSIQNEEEARAYLAHPVLGPRLRECAAAALAVEEKSAAEIFGYPDDLKFRSSATLFAAIAEPGSVFQQLLEKYFAGQPDERTLEFLKQLK